jgi:acyl-CoA synthetase (AMP-forming)/AMP-acid ligase II
MVANTLVVVPAMLHSMVQSAADLSFPTVRLILVGGQSIVGYGGDGLYDRVCRMFPNARVVQTYACTEAGSSITFEDLTAEVGCNDFPVTSHSNVCLEKIRALPPSDDNLVFTGPGTCVGYPPSHVQIGIFHIDKAAEAAKAHGLYSLLHLPPQLLVSHGIIGIIGTRGPHVMSRYWNRSIIDGSDDDTIAVDDDHDGWVLTNDLGYIDPVNRKLFFCGRADDIIRTGGESVLAMDVERVIVDFKEDDYIIVECSVFPLPDERFGETVCAALVLSTSAEVGVKNDVTPSVEEDKHLTKRIRQYCTTRQLASFKQPRRVFRVLQGVLPRNSSGKVLKHAVIKMCASNSKEISRL